MIHLKDDKEKVAQTIMGGAIKDVAVFRTNKFPAYNQDIITQSLVIAINLNGSCSVLYNNYKDAFSKNEIAVVLPNHIIRATESDDNYDVMLLVISSSFIDEFKYRSLSHDHIKFHSTPSVKLSDSEIETMVNVAQLLKQVSESNIEHRHDILINLLNVFIELLRSYRLAHNTEVAKYTRNEDLFNRFCELLAKHSTESREVLFYADKLCLTPKYFSKIIHDVTNQSAGVWITNYVTTISKQLLTTRPDLNIQSISNLMGFNDQAAFSRYFRRAAGMSPKEFRESLKKV